MPPQTAQDFLPILIVQPAINSQFLDTSVTNWTVPKKEKKNKQTVIVTIETLLRLNQIGYCIWLFYGNSRDKNHQIKKVAAD